MSGTSDATLWRPSLERIASALDELGAMGWIVGGSLRDALLGLPVRDIDLAVTADPLTVAHRLTADGKGSIARLRRGTVRVALAEFPQGHLDLSRLHGSRIEDDLALRDFRINALALPLTARERFLEWLEHDGEPWPTGLSELVDPFAGLDELHARRLDVVSERVFRDDPGRILRGARLAAQMSLMPTSHALALAREAASLLDDLPDDRVREELNLLLALPRAATGFALLRDVGALGVLLLRPAVGVGGLEAGIETHALGSLAALDQLHADYQDNAPLVVTLYERLPLDALRAWYAANAPGESLPRIVALGWATVLHAATPHEAEGANAASGHGTDQPQPARPHIVRGLPRRVASALHTWREAQALVASDPLDETAVRLFFDRLGPRGAPAVDALMVALACQWAMVVEDGSSGENALVRMAEHAGRIFTMYFEHPDLLLPPHLLDGADLIREVGLAPGPLVGRILREIRAAQVAGKLTTVEEALAYARTLASNLG